MLNNKKFPGPFRFDEQKKLRLILDNATYDGILDAAFKQIRQYAHGRAYISIRLLEIFHAVADSTEDKERIKGIRRHAEMVHWAGSAALAKEDCKDLEDRYHAFIRLVKTKND